eukprot:gene220-1764_t
MKFSEARNVKTVLEGGKLMIATAATLGETPGVGQYDTTRWQKGFADTVVENAKKRVVSPRSAKKEDTRDTSRCFVKGEFVSTRQDSTSDEIGPGTYSGVYSSFGRKCFNVKLKEQSMFVHTYIYLVKLGQQLGCGSGLVVVPIVIISNELGSDRTLETVLILSEVVNQIALKRTSSNLYQEIQVLC